MKIINLYYKKRAFNPERSRSGFTLVELLVTISIIGILATVIFINLQGAQAKSRDSKRKSDLSMIMSAIVMYASDNGGQLPPSDDLIEINPVGLAPLITGGYIDKIPKDPKCVSSSCAAASTYTGYLYYRADTIQIVPTATACASATAGSIRKGSVYTSLEKPSTDDSSSISSTFDNCVKNGMRSYSQAGDGTSINFKLSN